jgi:hypothetical protein
MVDRTNFVQVLSNLPTVAKFKDLLYSLYFNFSNSFKRHLEFTKLAKFVKIGGLKISQNVKTWWINMLEPLKHVMSKYKVH